METTLGEIIDEHGGSIKTGPFGTTLKASEYTPTGVPLISVKEIGSGSFHIDDKTPRVDHSVTSRLPEYLLEEGDIVFARKGSVERSAIVGPEQDGWFLGSDGIRLRLPAAVSSLYVRYWISQGKIKEWLHQHSTGSTMASLNQKTIARIPIFLPTIEKQKTISDVLSAFDNKIELNGRMNETLEAMARAVFKDWFVDFGPTRRKAAGETEPVAILGGLLPDPAKAAELTALFPSGFGDNGLPQGWDEQPLDQIAEFLNGLALQKYPAKPGEDSMPVIKIAELRNGVTSKSNRASRSVPDKYVLKDGDYIFSWSGSLMAKYWTEGEGALNQHLFKVTSETHPMWVVSNWVEHHLAEFQRIAAAKAVTMGHIKRSHLSEAMCVLPRPDDLAPMGEVIQPIMDLMIQNELENQTLAATRELLLPKLMSGEIRLKDAEAVG